MSDTPQPPDPSVPVDAWKEEARQFQQEYLSAYTEIQQHDSQPWTAGVLAALREAARLFARIRDGVATERQQHAEAVERLQESERAVIESAQAWARRAEAAEAQVTALTEARDALQRGGVGLIAAERQRQVSQEGWTPEHDDTHTDGSLAGAAACLAVESTDGDFLWVNYEPVVDPAAPRPSRRE
jgi:glucose/arabinose dehydrogenase